MVWDLPERGVVYWPVGKGDAVTVVIDPDTLLQVDLNHRTAFEDDDSDCVPVVDRLVELLGDDPYLPALAVTHHDEDHCSGFSKLNEQQVRIGELWITLRSFVEDADNEELTEAGQAVYDEACRRRDEEIAAAKAGKARADDGSRLRVIGYASLLDAHEDWEGFPRHLVTVAGDRVETVNEQDVSDRCEIFVHTPYRSDTEGPERNSSSLGLHVTLKSGTCEQRFLLLGDLCHAEIEAFVEKTEEKDNTDALEWDILLAPHHGSRNAVRLQDGEDWADATAADYLKKYAAEGAKVIISSRAFEDVGADDSDPPHEDARTMYAAIVGDDNVLLTADYADGSDSDPLTILVEDGSCGDPQETKAQRMSKVTTASIANVNIRRGNRTTSEGDQGFA